jgi:uncharacterized membrane protein
MNKTRLEAFSDGVIAIIITIMVLEFKVPHSGEWEALRPLTPTLLCYILSFTYVGIYWNNHHHMLHTAKHVSAAMMWSNLLLLFWLSLNPFGTSWMGENHFPSAAVALYAIILIMCGISYDILRRSIIKAHPHDHLVIRTALQAKLEINGLYCELFHRYTSGIFLSDSFSVALFGFVAAMWFIPDSEHREEREGMMTLSLCLYRQGRQDPEVCFVGHEPREWEKSAKG